MNQRILPPSCVPAVLAALYPTVRWERVGFHLGLPRWARPFTRVAITLPHPLATHRIGIHVAEPHWAPCTAAGMALLVHEAMHVLQYQERRGGVGLGMVRIFSLQYLAVATLQGGGRRNLYEEPAYAQEEAFLAACGALRVPLCAPGAQGRLTPGALPALLRQAPWLVRRSSADPSARVSG
jgi:hypothetical protein